MHVITVGSIIERARKEQKAISQKTLIQGICSIQTLYAIETNQYKTDILLVDILLQRLGKSPDKLEIILSQEAYQLVRQRDLIEEAILRGRKALAAAALEAYPAQNNVNQMYQKRMQACLSYRIDNDHGQAAELMRHAIELTLPDFSYEKIEDYLISTVEMENLLALERVQCTRAAQSDLQPDTRHLELCMQYIDDHFTDSEEHAKICAKCAWLLAKAYLDQGQAAHAMVICEKGINELRSHTMIYFMLPLLELMVQIGTRLGMAPEQNRYVKYLESLRFVWDSYAQPWYPTDMLLHNCYQKEYHLDHELIKSERTARKLSQQELSAGIYKNVSSFSNFEKAKVAPNRKTIEKLMEKLNIERGLYNGFVTTDSFEVMELRHQLNIALAHDEYRKAKDLLDQLRSQLDTAIAGNRYVLEDAKILIDRKLQKITTEAALERQQKLFESLLDTKKEKLRHIPMRNEVLIINHYCGILIGSGQKNKAADLYTQTIGQLRRSHIDVRYRYRSFSLLLCNYVYCRRDHSTVCEVLKNELFCGKSSVLSFCLIDLLHIWGKEEKSDQKCMKLSESIYYISDLYNFINEKEKFDDFLLKKGVKTIR